MLIAFLILLVGTVSAIRMSHFFVVQKIILRSSMPKIGTLYFLAVIAVLIFSGRSLLHLWIGVFLPLLFFLAVVAVLKARREARFREEIYHIMNRLILKMKSGKSLRHAMGDLLQEVDPFMRHKFGEIFDFVVFSQHQEKKPSAFVSAIIFELKKVDEEPHAAIRRLITYRDRLQIEAEFRRRSGQIVQQIRIQAILLSGLYLAVLLFVGREFGFRKNLSEIGISLLLFFIGLAWIVFGGRKMRWKV